MKRMSALKALFVSAALLTGSTAFAVGPEESSCASDPSAACKSTNPEVLAFRKNQVKQLYNELIYPGPIEVLKDTMNASHLFEPAGVSGRVTPLGKFSDFTGVVEYFYALAANVNTHVYGITFKHALAEEDKVYISAELAMCDNKEANCEAKDESFKKKNTLTEVGIFQFNKANKIIFFDLQIPNLGAAKDTQGALNRASMIAGVCAFLTVGHINPITGEQVKGGTCTSHFDSSDDFAPGFLTIPKAPFLNCVHFMSSIPYGTWDRANSNTFTCRQLHTLLTPLRPEIHCAHVAYGGGGKCEDFPYESYYGELEHNNDHHH